MPLTYTIKPIISVLAIANYQIKKSIFILGKIGTAYFRTMTDNLNVPSESKIRPELQVGVGYNLTSKYRISLNYQYFFGQSVRLSHINSAAGTAKLNNVPSGQSALIEFDMNL